VLKKNFILAFTVLCAAALLFFSGCDNPSQVHDIYSEWPPGQNQSGAENETGEWGENPNIPDPIWSADLKHFIDGGVGWITAGSGGTYGSNGFSVVLLYDDPASVVPTSVTPWNYKVRLIAVYRYAEGARTLHALGELDQAASQTISSGTDERKLIVRMLTWDTANVYYRTGNTNGVLNPGTLTAEQRRELYEKAQVVYPSYTLGTGGLNFSDGWLAPELQGTALVKKTLHPKLEGRAFADAAGTGATYHFKKPGNLYGSGSLYYTEGSTLGAGDGYWWSVGDEVFTETGTGTIASLGVVVTDAADKVSLSSGGVSYSQIFLGGGGFADRIWILPKSGASDYISFGASKLRTSTNLDGAAVTPTHLSNAGGTDWYAADGGTRIYVQKDSTNPNAIILFNLTSGVNYAASDRTLNLNTGSTVLQEIQPAAALGAWSTLKGIWAARKSGAGAGYFYFDSQDDPQRAITSASVGGFTVYVRVTGDSSASETGDLFGITQTAGNIAEPDYRGSYTYDKTAFTLDFSNLYTSVEEVLSSINTGSGGPYPLVKLNPGTDTGLWIQNTIGNGNVRYIVFSANGLLNYGTGGPDAWASPSGIDLPWYINGDNLFVIKADGELASVGVFSSQKNVLSSTSHDVFGGSAFSINRVIAADNTEFKGNLWGKGGNPAGAWAAIYEDPLNAGKYGYSIMGFEGVKGGLYRGNADPSALYLYDTNESGQVKLVFIGNYSKSGYMNTADYIINITGGISNLGGLTQFKKGSSSLVSNDGAYLAWLGNANSRFMVLKGSGDATVDTQAGPGGVVKGIFYASDGTVSAGNGLYILDDTGAFKQLGNIASVSGGKITALTAITGSVPGAVTLNALTTGNFNTKLGSDKWADAAGSLRWLYAGEDKTLRYGSSGITSGSAGYNTFYEEDTAALVKNFYSLEPETGDAVYFGAYNGSGQDTIIFSGTGGVLSSLGTVRKLESGAAGIKGLWASSKNTQESTFLEIADNTIMVEKGSYTNSFAVPVPGSRIASNTTLLSYLSGGTYALYGLNDNGDIAYYGTSGLLKPRSGADALTPGSASAILNAFTGLGSPLYGLVFEGINDFDLPQDLVGSWMKDGGGSAGRDDILISDTGLTIGGNDASPSGTFVYGAKNLGGTLYATLVSAAPTPNYQWKFYVHNEKNGLVYIGQGAFTRTGAAAGVDTLTFSTQTTVVKGSSVFKK
jgi:hypothetical protein